MRLLIRVVVFVMVLLVGLVGIGFLLADKVHVERSAKILASPSTLYAVLNSFEKFDQWSPWADLDPHVKVERSGPASGVGARYTWHGNADVGAGSQEIIATTPDSEVKIELDFEGFDQPSTSTLAIKPDGNGSLVTWSMDSELGSNPIHRYFGLMMDKYIGQDYEKGLGRLKALAESLPPPAPAAPEAEPAAAPEPAAAS
ncbi:SRPBCC family protein [Nevskia ramosa]|uniref:SRPBCC family protein n=1 Tax=Nevskia ramosa TaxID=64002 RepID=UPI002353F5BA|nr:SRPBCC family protein [Nevskia ramosa]